MSAGSAKWQPKPSGLALWLILILAAAARLYGMGKHGPWQDEWTVLMNAVGLVGTSYNNVLLPPPPQDAVLLETGDLLPRDFWAFNNLRELTAAGTREDSGNGWIHKILIHYWIELGGVGESALRLPSLVFGVIGVLLTFLLAQALQVPRAGCLIAAGLVATHPLLIRSSQEVRGYTLATALSLLSSLLIVRIVRTPSRALRWHWAAYITCVFLSFLCHYLVLSIVVAHVAYLAVVHPPRNLVVRAALAGLSLAGLLLVWYTFMGKEALQVASLLSQDFSHRADLSLAGSYALPATPRYLLAGLTQLTLAQYGNQLQDAGLRLRVLIPLLLVPGALTVLALRALQRKDETGAAWFLVACGFAYALLALGASILQGHNILFGPRYAQFSAPYTAILLGVAASTPSAPASRRVIGLLFGAHVAVVLMSLVPAYEARIGGLGAPPRSPNRYSEAARLLAAEYRPGDVVKIQNLVDAKRLNLYLRDAPDIRQRIESGLPKNRIVLVRDAQDKLVLVGE